MAARTTTKDGSISDATMLNGSTPWVTGDTLTYSHNITIDIDIDAGVGGATGTTAIAASSSVTGKTLTVNSGVRVICRGNLNLNSSYNGITTLTNNGRISMIPPSGSTYVLNMTNNCPITGIGTFDADLSGGGGNPYMQSNNDRCQGLSNASSMTFTDWGDSTHFGLICKGRNVTGVFDFSVTNCTFTRSSFQVSDAYGTYDNNFTFTGNVFTNPTAVDIGGGLAAACEFTFSSNGTSSTRTVDNNHFEVAISFARYYPRMTFTNNQLVSTNSTIIYMASGSSWTSSDNWKNNLIFFDGGAGAGAGGLLMPSYGPVKDCLLINTQSGSNPHFISASHPTNNVTFDGVIFYASGSGGGSGDCIFPSGGSGALNVFRCLVLPDADGKTSGNLVSTGGAGTTSVQTCEHNTMVTTGGELGLMRQNHLGESFAGQIASCRSNLLLGYGNSTGCKAVSSSTGVTDGATNAVTNAGFNAFLNPATNQTCKYNTTTSQATVTGYNRTVISANTPYPNATIGHDDFTITSDPIVDSSYMPEKWALANGGSQTIASLQTIIKSDRSKIMLAGSTALIPTIRAKWSVTGAAGLQLKDAGHDGVTIGMGEYVAASTGRRNRMNTLLRP